MGAGAEQGEGPPAAGAVEPTASLPSVTTPVPPPAPPRPTTSPSARGQEEDWLQESRRVGRFLLLKVLGRGGMGVVYAAYDPDLDRRVALKLLLARGSGAEVEAGRARLVREAQAMARISHPHVIPVFEVGTWGAQVFVAMELVEGGTLRDWLEARRRSWREVLEHFIAAGRGLAAAHAAGLVHRDFKPANVLVSRTGRVYVTDFGLARPVEGQQVELQPGEGELPLPPPTASPLLEPITQAGMVVGTPNYMSPEQFSGNAVDARSDQFSFCAALYWALYGQRPFTPEAQGPITIAEPPRNVPVPAWVRQAVMRGLALDAQERFASMEELLEALSAEQRLRQRRRWVAAACGAVLVLGAAGGWVYRQSQVCAGAGQLLASTWGPQARQQVGAAFAATGSPLARDMAQRASEVLDRYAQAWVGQYTQACEATRVRGVQTEALLSQRVVCLERRRKELQALVGALSQVDAAGVAKAVDAAWALPSPQACADVEALGALPPRPVDPARRARVEQLEGQVAEVKALLDLSRYPQGLERARQLEAPVLQAGYLPLVAELHFHTGWLQAMLGELEEASRLLEQAVMDAEAGRLDRLQVSMLNRLVWVEGGRQRFEQARQWARLGEATLARTGGDPELQADLLLNQANLALLQLEPEQARALLERAAALQAPVLEPGHPKRVRVQFTLGRTLADMGEYAQAVPVLEQALRQIEAALGPQHLDAARFHVVLARALRGQGKLEQALEHARTAVALHKAALGPRQLRVADMLDEEGMVLLGLKRYPEALAVYQEALAIKQEHLEPGEEPLQYSYDGVGQALVGLGRTREALEPLRQALAITQVPPDALADSGFALARALWSEGQAEEARAEAARARERYTQADLPERAAAVQAWLDSLGEAGR